MQIDMLIFIYYEKAFISFFITLLKETDMEQRCIIKIIKASLWNDSIEGITISEDVFQEMKKHTIVSLPGSILSKMDMPEELRRRWKKELLQQIAYSVNYRYIQEHLPIKVPYVIIKGTTAAQYYPYPEYRTMGDIDILTKREDFDTAYKQFTENGYQVINRLNREIALRKNGVTIELHKYFASIPDTEKAKKLDDLIIHNINSTHVLPDLINGIVLLEHISQHMEHGLGLRQIIDWMMFVDKYLSDENWQEFASYAQENNLERLAIVTTRMCEIYLGLPLRKWSSNADEKKCDELLEYVLSCGNFGIKRNNDSSKSESTFIALRKPQNIFRLLHDRGLSNWSLAKEYKVFRPVAWLYQLFRYISRGLKRENATYKIKEEYNHAKQRYDLFNYLGVCQSSQGRIVYKDNKYQIEDVSFR